MLLGGIVGAALPTPEDTTTAQTVLPEVVVSAPTPIARPRPRPRPRPVRARRVAASTTPQAPPAPPAEPPPGWLPIVADQFATVTVVTPEDIQRSPGGTLGDVLFSRPRITGSGFAPGASSRPIVRGLDVNRVGIQENGIGAMVRPIWVRTISYRSIR
jgi:iron complex outermembrane receptor protein